MSESALTLAELFSAAADALASREADPDPAQAALERAAVVELLRTMAAGQARYAQLPVDSIAATRALADTILAAAPQ